MKSFKAMMAEVAEPNSEEEKAFKAQHKVAISKHPVATEFQHKGVAKPKAKRLADQEGSANYDLAYESANLDEMKVKNSDAVFKLETEISNLEKRITKLKPAALKDDDANMMLARAKKSLKQKQDSHRALMREEAVYMLENPQEEIPMMMSQLAFICYAAEEISGMIKLGGDPEEWFQNKLAGLYSNMQGLYSYMQGKNQMGEAHYMTKKEELSAKQKKIDLNKNGKVDGNDLAMLRARKNEAKIPKGYHKMPDGTIMKDSDHKEELKAARSKQQGVTEGRYPDVDHMPGKRGIGLDSAKSKDTYVKTFHASKEKEAQEFAKKNGHIVKKHVYPKSANNSQPHEFQVHKNEKGMNESQDVESIRERIAALQRDLKAVTGSYPGDARNRSLIRSDIFRAKEQLKTAREQNRASKGLKEQGVTENYNLDELSKKTLGSYVKKAANSLDATAYSAGRHGEDEDYIKSMKRRTGIEKAADRLTKEGYASAAQRKAVWASRNEKGVKEELKGNQHKLDKNKNGKIDAQDFKLLKKEAADKPASPFDLKNYKSQIPTKAGEKAGFDSKKVSTGTVYSRKPVKEAAYEKDMDDKKKVIVKGVKGMKSTPFTKTFRNMAAYDKWSDSDAAGDYEVKQVMNESADESLDEAFKPGIVKLKDGASTVLNKEDADILNKLLGKMSGGSVKKMTETAMKDKNGFAEILAFAKETA